MSRRKNGQSPFETAASKADARRHMDNVKLLKTNAVLPLTRLGDTKVARPPQGFIKGLPKGVEPSFLPTKRTEEGFDPNAYKLMSKAGYDFASSSNPGKKVSNTVNNKECNLTETQKKLKKHGYGVDNNKAGLGFTPNAPVKISSKAKNASAQHISVSVEQDQEEPKSAPRTSVFRRVNRSRPRVSALNRIGGQNRTSVFKRLNMPTSQSSVFERLSRTKDQSNTASYSPRRSTLERLEDNKKLSRNRETAPKEERLNGLAEKDDIRSSIPSRMKRQAILEVDTNGPLKVRRRTIIHTGQSSGQQAQKDITEGEVQDIFPFTILKDKEDEIPKEDVTSSSSDSKSSPRPLGACSSSSEVEGLTYATPKKLHMKPTLHPQIHQTERGQETIVNTLLSIDEAEIDDINAADLIQEVMDSGRSLNVAFKKSGELRAYIEFRNHNTRKDGTEEEVQDVFHITIQEGEEDEIPEEDVTTAPPQLEDGGQATVDDLKELNLGTKDEPKPIFVNALLSADEIEDYY